LSQTTPKGAGKTKGISGKVFSGKYIAMKLFIVDV
jgi:hypothetical protein